MKAVYLKEYGGRDKLIFGELPKPEPKPGEVLVRVKAAGVNPVDWKIRDGRLKERMPCRFPIIPGWDLAGVVEDRGLGARRFEVGEKVYAYARKDEIHDGTYAQYISLPESYLAQKPKNVTFEKAAVVPLSALTAYQSLFDRAGLKRGETCVIVGASGGVGSFAVQFAKFAAAKVIAVASKKNHAYVQTLGAKHMIDYQNEDVTAAVLGLCPKGADVVFDLKGGESLKASYDRVRPGGRLVTITEPGDAKAAEAKGINLLYHFVEPHSPQLELFREWIEKGRLLVNVAKVFPLEKAAEAQAYVEVGHTRGKVVLKIT